MCGIVGYVDPGLSPAEGRTRLSAMAQSILHRGPDDWGVETFDCAGLAMRRLAILDLEHGHQPMLSADGRFVLVFNGEIYNHAELRADLAGRGWPFRTRSDTEVLLAAWVLLGPACLERLNGMFAFAVWDKLDRRMVLGRDRLGVKPFYYSWTGQRLLFGSEIKAIAAFGAWSGAIDPRGLSDYLTFRYVPGPGSIWRDVAKLPPGHILTLEAGSPPVVARWWDIPYAKRPAPRSGRRLLAEFTDIFTDAVRLRMLADVPVGITLSGGLDSSAVAAVAREIASGPVESFSVAFADSPATDERAYAREVARALGLTHHEVVVSQDDFMTFLPGFVRQTDEPLADLASIPLYYLSRLARNSVKVVLSGEGADEILAGYDFDMVMGQWSTGGGWWRRLTGRALPDLRTMQTPPHMTNYMEPADKAGLLGAHDPGGDSMDRVRAAISRCGSDHPLHQMLYSYCQDWLVEDLLMKADKMSMAASLELRTPFLDYRLVEWASRAPASVKVGSGRMGRWSTKAVLRRFAASRLPAAIIERPKQGFPVPVYDWLSGPLRQWARDVLGRGARAADWLDPTRIAETVALGTADAPPPMDRHRLWNLLVLETWLQEWSPRC